MHPSCKAFAAVLLGVATAAQAFPASGGPYLNSTVAPQSTRLAPNRSSGTITPSQHSPANQAPAVKSPSTARNESSFNLTHPQADQTTSSKPSTTLVPSVHRDIDTKSTENLKPTPPGAGSQLFYGNSDPSRAGHFAFLKLYFTSHVVNLDHFEYAAVRSVSSASLDVEFKSKEALTRAAETWSASEGLVLVTYSKICGNYDKSERCYFKVSNLSSDSSLGAWKIMAKGHFESLDRVTSGGETQWGWWSPHGKDETPQPREGTAKAASRVPKAGPRPETASHSFVSRSSERQRRNTVVKRWFWDKIWQAIESWTKLEMGIEKKQLTWVVPDSAASLSAASKAPDDQSHESISPWQNAIPMRNFGSADSEAGFMNIFCVDCGTFGNATFAGRASWDLVNGITEGRVELDADMAMSLKIGIEAEMSHEAEFSKDMFRAGLPGLSYGIVTIGPQLSVSVRGELQASAKGRLLVGAEMGFRNAHVVMDLVDSASAGSKSNSLNPYFKPTLEAEGELALSATLRLPVSLELGLQIGSWHKAVALVDEPSMKATAEVAATASSADDAGLGEVDGCKGLSAQLSLRNKLFVNVLDLQDYPLHDTGEHEISRQCIQ